MSKNQVNITYYQFNIKLKLFNNSITKEKICILVIFLCFWAKALDKYIYILFNKK